MIHLLTETKLRLGDDPLPFQTQHQSAIDAQWAEEIVRLPRLWNGPQFLFSDVRVEDDVLFGTAHRTDFATFMFWRKYHRDVPDAPVHITGTSLPYLIDGSMLAVRMAQHTANAGQAYFPAGSLDPDDVVDGHIDIDRNIARETLEETGFAVDIDRTEGGYVAAQASGAWHIGYRFGLGMDIAEAQAAVAAHQAATGDDELAGVFAVETPEDALDLRPYARMLAEWHFANPPRETVL